MPELKEVFEMVSQKVEPDLDSWNTQEQRQRRTARNRRLGAFALVAGIAIAAAVIAISTAQPGDRKRTGGQTVPDASTHFILDLRTGASTPLPESLAGGLTYSVSPDGTMVAFAPWPNPIGDDRHLKVYIASIDGSAVRPASAESSMDEINPRWSPNGQIVYQGRQAHTEEIGDLYLLDPDNGARTKLTNLPARSSHHWFMSPSFSSDGQTILFNLPRGQLEDQTWDLWTIPATGGEPRLVLRRAAHGSYSPDGTQIAYVGGPRYEGDTFAGTGIWLADAEGRHPRLLVMAPGEQEELSWPRWSPDGTRIAYTFQSAVYVVDVETGQIAKVVDGGTPEWLDEHTLIVGRA